jgi:hypothetical protein
MVEHDGELVCAWCGKHIGDGAFHVDHVVARANGGSAKDLQNCVVSCPHCNHVKNSRDAAMVFGYDVFACTLARLAHGVQAADVYKPALEIFKCGRNWQQRARLAQAFVLFGTLPERNGG